MLATIHQIITPMKAASRDHLATIDSSSSLPEKTQNVIKPTGGKKKDIM